MPLKSCYTRSDLLVPEMRISQHQQIEMYYSPHNDYINSRAKLFIVGITPGWNQMELACRTAIHALHHGYKYEEACFEAKQVARFAGAMRVNLIAMLQEIGVSEWLNLHHVSELFDEHSSLLHTTSLLAYPVFTDGKNYNGHTPSMITNEYLYQAVRQTFIPQLLLLDHPALIPLGKAVEQALKHLIEMDYIKEEKVLWGFPHPSGANGHRKLQFAQHKEALMKRVKSFYT